MYQNKTFMGKLFLESWTNILEYFALGTILLFWYFFILIHDEYSIQYLRALKWMDNTIFGPVWLTVKWYLTEEALTYTHVKYSSELDHWGYSWSNFLVQCASVTKTNTSKMEVSMKLSQMSPVLITSSVKWWLLPKNILFSITTQNQINP